MLDITISESSIYGELIDVDVCICLNGVIEKGK
jgi:hypothetical protein